MLIYVYEGDPREHRWHVGEESYYVPDTNGPVKRLTADGYELEYILAKFRNLPRTIASVQTWNDPFATFILLNI